MALADKREIKGRVIGVDPSTDIALLKIDVRGLPAVPWGDSSQLKVGEWVLAIGSPYQLNQTVTAGIISATGRAGLGFADYEDFIQTDAAINRGNSGGALINGRGELIGINTGIFSESGGYQGIGFAVPSNLARRIVNDLMEHGEVRRGSIGPLTLEKLTDQLAAEVGARGTNGAVVTRMFRNSEAYSVGVRPGDVIVGLQRPDRGRPVAVRPLRRRRQNRIDRVGARGPRGPHARIQAADRLDVQPENETPMRMKIAGLRWRCTLPSSHLQSSDSQCATDRCAPGACA